MNARDRLWREAAAELSPAKSLARMEDKAKQVVTSVSLVGSLLTGLGLVASGQLERSGPALVLAIITVCVALLAVVTAVGSLLLRFTPTLAPGNLAEVESWYRRQFRRVHAVRAAGILVLVAVLFAGAAAVVVLTDRTRPHRPSLTLQVTGTGDASKLTARVEFAGLPAGRLVQADVVGIAADGSRTVLAKAVMSAGKDKTTTANLEVPKVAGYQTLEVAAVAPGQRCTATLSATGSANPTLSCTRT